MLTMADIARLSGYSRVTVSAVIGNKPGVSKKARDKILKVVKEHNYTPNLMATALKHKSTNLIGLIVRDITNPYFMKLAEGVEKVLSKQGYNILYINTAEEHVKEVEALKNLSSYRVAGVILTPILKGVSLTHVQRFQHSETPLISIEKIPDLQLDYVDFDNEQAGRLATEYLIKRGHKNLCYLAGPKTSIASEQRGKGFKSISLEHGVKAKQVSCGSGSEDGYLAALDLLKDLKYRPSAIFCFSDMVALGVYKAAHQLKIRIPEEISIVGCDDINIASILGPALTTISFSINRVGEYVARYLIDCITNNSPRAPLSKVFFPELVERDSVQKF